MLMLTCIGFRPLHLEGSTSGSAALITSTAGAWGDWGKIQNCAHANVLTGAQIRSESPRKLKTADDTAGLLAVVKQPGAASVLRPPSTTQSQ